ADACEHRHAAVFHGDVVDQFLNNDRLADACTTKCANLAAPREGTDQINYLDARFKDLCLCILIDQRRCGALDWVALIQLHRTTPINRIAGEMEQPSGHTISTWHVNGAASISHFHAALQTIG